MEKPHIPDALGLAWRPRKNGWAAIWVARSDIVQRGFKPSTHQIMVLTDAPTRAQEITIRKECIRLQDEMYMFADGKKKATFDGTLRALLLKFETDPDSNYHGWEFHTRRDYHNHAQWLVREFGHLTLAKQADEDKCINARTIKRIYEKTRWPSGKDDSRGKVNMAHARIGALRAVFTYGVVFEADPNCSRIREILSSQHFEKGRPRTEAMTLRQCEDIIAAAHQLGVPSIALAQAIQFDWRVRQRDVIGLWLPETEPGISVVPHHHRRKWLRGMRHEEISAAGIINHPVSKGRRQGKILERDINLYPMIKTEYDRIPEDKRHGPIIVCEATGRPWKDTNFRDTWRKCAKLAGVPKSVWNMDSRAGGITETIEATGGNVEAARKEADHTDIKTTMRYSRRKAEAIKEATVLVGDFRAKNKR